MKTRGQLPHLFYPEPTMQRRQINSYAFPMGFDPLSLSPVLWLDASDSSTLFDSVSGGALPADGAAVNRWADKSTSANHATLISGVSAPTRSAALVNGLDALTFTGVNLLELASDTPNNNTQTVFAVFRRASAGSRMIPLGNRLPADNNRSFLLWWDDNVTYWAPGAANDNLASSSSSATGTFILTGIRNSSTWTLRRNAVQIATATGRSTTNTIYGHIGGRSTNFYTTGDICEILLCPAVLTSEQITEAETSLMTKWGI